MEECFLKVLETKNGITTTSTTMNGSVGGSSVVDDGEESSDDAKAASAIKKIKSITLNEEIKSTKAVAARTITNSHPLMLNSPTGTDSDTEQDNIITTIRNFPDLIPENEQKKAKVAAAAATTAIATALNDFPTKSTTKLAAADITTTTKLVRTNSRDLLSSGSDADISPYHAAVESNFQTVALLPKLQQQHNEVVNNKINNNCKNNNNTQHLIKRNYNNNKNNNNNNNSNNNNNNNNDIKNIRNLAGCEDISSLDSISNQSFDNEPNLASLSPSSSVMDIEHALHDKVNDVNGEDDDDDDDGGDGDIDDDDDNIDNLQIINSKFQIAHTTQENTKSAEKLPQYSALDERRDVRNWKKITLPNGSTREIDMRVIEPYKRVLSHGGYLQAGGHNAIVLFCGCHLPDRSRTDYNYVMDNLFLYVVKTLEQLVTEDYVLVYLHGGSDRRSVPPFPWLKK